MNSNKRYKIDNYSFNNNDNSSQIQNINLQNQIIELNNNINILKDNNIINLNNNNNNCDNNNSIYNKVFNNNYIRRIIFNHLNIYNILYPVDIKFESIKEFQQFKYKEYLHRIILDFEDDQFELIQLPMNIKHITIRQPKIINNEHYEIIQLPDHIESVSYIYRVEENYINSLSKQPHSSKIKTLNIHCLEEEILPNRIPNSVTDLEMDTIRLPNNVLPSNLKKLTINHLKSFEDNCLQIESLTHICILYSTPLIFDQLSTPFFKNLVKLEFINENAIIDSDIQFPNNLKELIVYCKSFNYISQIETNQIYPFKFPLSLEILSLCVYGDDNDNDDNDDNDDTENVHFESLPPNLKSLELSISNIVDNKGLSILPSKLETLIMTGSFNQELQVNQLPSTLTYLSLGYVFNQVIDVNILPANLNTLFLGESYSQIINPLAIPQQLKLLQLGKYYPHSINLTSTHPNTIISCESLQVYYQATSPDYNQIRVLRLPDCFNSPLSTLQLQNKSNLEYLYLGRFFNHPIELSDLPTQNNIKTLEIGYDYRPFNNFEHINLEHFQKLETIIINSPSNRYRGYSNPTIITTTTTIIDDQQQQHVHYNNYKLKNIIVNPKNVRFLKQLDINFYQFIKYHYK